MLERIVPRGFDKRIWVIFIGNLVNMFGQSMVWLFLTVYLNIQLGISMTYIGTMFLVGTWVSLIFQVIGGSLCDSWGRKAIMTTGLFSQAVLFILLGLAHDKTAIFILFVVEGAVGSLYRPAAQAMIADLVEEKDRVEAYGALRVGANAGYGLGAMVGGFLAASTYSNLFFLAGGTNIFYGVLALVFLTETLPDKSVETSTSTLRMIGAYFRGYRSVAKDTVMIFYAIGGALESFAYSQSGTTFSVFAMTAIGISTKQIGYMWAMNAWIVVFLQMPLAAYIKKLPITRALAMGSALYMSSFAILPFVQTYAHVIAFMLIFTAGELVISPVLMTFVANIAPCDMRGRYMAFSNITQSIGHSLGPFVGGRMLDVAPASNLWALTAFASLLSALSFLRLKKYIGADSCEKDLSEE